MRLKNSVANTWQKHYLGLVKQCKTLLPNTLQMNNFLTLCNFRHVFIPMKEDGVRG